MRDKIISFLLWVLVWWLIVYGYTYYNESKIETTSWFPTNWQTRWNFDPSNMSDEQLQRIADRQWISVGELKEKMSSWGWFTKPIWSWAINDSWSWLSNADSK